MLDLLDGSVRFSVIGATCFPLLRPDSPAYFTQFPVNREDFQPMSWSRHYFWLCVIAEPYHLFSFWVVLSLASSYSPQACTSQLNTTQRSILSGIFFLWTSLLSRCFAIVVFPLPQLHLLNSGLLLGCPSCAMALKLPQGSELGQL